MRRKTIVFLGSAIGVLVLLGLLRQVMSQRAEVVSLPMDAAEQAFDHIQSSREAEAQSQAEADREFIEQSQLLRAHEVVRVGLAEWKALSDPEICNRAKTLEEKLTTWKEKTGQSMEMILQQELAAHLQRVDRWHQANPGISGEAEAIEMARAIRGYTEAWLYLADKIYSGEAVELCQDNYAREIARLSQVFNEVSARVETTEQQMTRLRAEQVARAKEVWEKSGTPEPQPTAPANSEPAPEVEAQEPSSSRTALGKLFYGDE